MIGPDHKFAEPVKLVKSVDDVKKWETSKAYEVRGKEIKFLDKLLNLTSTSPIHPEIHRLYTGHRRLRGRKDHPFD